MTIHEAAGSARRPACASTARRPFRGEIGEHRRLALAGARPRSASRSASARPSTLDARPRRGARRRRSWRPARCRAATGSSACGPAHRVDGHRPAERRHRARGARRFGADAAPAPSSSTTSATTRRSALPSGCSRRAPRSSSSRATPASHPISSGRSSATRPADRLAPLPGLPPRGAQLDRARDADDGDDPLARRGREERSRPELLVMMTGFEPQTALLDGARSPRASTRAPRATSVAANLMPHAIATGRAVGAGGLMAEPGAGSRRRSRSRTSRTRIRLVAPAATTGARGPGLGRERCWHLVHLGDGWVLGAGRALNAYAGQPHRQDRAQHGRRAARTARARAVRVRRRSRPARRRADPHRGRAAAARRCGSSSTTRPAHSPFDLTYEARFPAVPTGRNRIEVQR